MSGIVFENVFKAYGSGPHVLRDVNLEIGANEFCVFIGPSGCGKSTMLRMIAGLEEISEGTLYIDGRKMNDIPSAYRGVAMVFQSYALFPHMTVYENMSFGLKIAKTPKKELDRKVREAARILQIEELLDRKPKALSGGQRQRVAIGRAIVRSPKVFLFDEPLSNLDTALRTQTRVEIARLHKSFPDASMVYVTHDQVEAMTLADKIVLLHTGEDVAKKGSIAQVGSPLELFHRPRNRFVAGFIGSPKMNFLPGVFESAADGEATVRITSGPQLRVAVRADGARPGDNVVVGVRPEHIVIGEGATQSIVCDIDITERLGTSTCLYTKYGDAKSGDLVACTPSDVAYAPGDRIQLGLPAENLHLFNADGDAYHRTAELPH